jgi:cysteinyl-tRNA synthetase
MTIKIKDSFSNKKEFYTISDNEVKIYTCGPTVYSNVSIGNLRSFISSDILKKSLVYLGFNIKDVMNITDVGHLMNDLDEGEDKIQKKSEETGNDIYEIIDNYTKYFFNSIKKVNIKEPSVISKASENIDSIIEIIKILESKGFVYQTSTGVYFDVSKFPEYDNLINQTNKNQKSFARTGVVVDKTKKNQQDFRLWQTYYKNHIMQWDSPWGRGFPGWHIECSAIIYKYLGENIDIHTSGIDLKLTHNVNEISQSRSAFDGNFVNFWVHSGMLLIDNKKMSKSLNNVYLIEDLEEKNFNPLALRYLYFNSHYSTTINFTFDSLLSAQNALKKLYEFIALNKANYDGKSVVNKNYKDLFIKKIEDDLDTPGMLDVLWTMVKDPNLNNSEKITTMLDFDNIFSFNFIDIFNSDVPNDLLELLNLRNKYRLEKDWDNSDKLRDKINSLGYNIIDLKDRSFLIKI